MPMRSLISCLLVVMLIPEGTEGADRISVIVPPAGQECAEELAGSLASSCNRGDFVAFMDHFTPAQERRVRSRMEDLFIKHQPQMEILKVTLLSEEENTITFGVRYAWHDRSKPEEVFASKVVARKVNGLWKLDGEAVKSVERSASNSGYTDAGQGDALPAVWNPFNPPANQIDPALEHLRGDIGIRPGLGCANGRCGR